MPHGLPPLTATITGALDGTQRRAIATEYALSASRAVTGAARARTRSLAAEAAVEALARITVSASGSVSVRQRGRNGVTGVLE